MSQGGPVSELVALLTNSMSPEKPTREAAEKILLETAEQKPSEIVPAFLDALKASDVDSSIKKAVCTWLQKIMSSYKTALPELYSKLSLPVQDKFKKEIFIILHNEKDAQVRKQIADTIGEVGGCLLSCEKTAEACGKQNSEMWPELLKHTFELYSVKDDPSVESALGILNVLFTYIAEDLATSHSDLVKILEEALQRPNLRIQTLGIQIICTLATSLPPKQAKHYKKFAVPMMKIQHDMFYGAQQNLDEAGEVMNVIHEIADTEPRFFKSNFKDLVELMSRVRSCKQADIGIKDQALEITVSISQRYPEFLQNDKDIVNKIIEMIFMHILEIPDECPEEWASPPDGFDPTKMTDDTQRTVLFSIGSLGELVEHVGSDFLLQQMSHAISTLVQTGEWKKIFAGFMALSELGEHLVDAAQIDSILQTLAGHSSHQEPRVRYAALFCIAQLSEELEPKFQEEYHATVLPLLLERINDPIPRVSAQACVACTAFLEHCTDDSLRPFFTTFYQKITEIIDTKTSYVKENALGALASLCIGSPTLFEPFFDRTMEVLLKLVTQINDPQFKRLRGNAIDCISLISRKYTKEVFSPYADRLIEGIVNVQTHHVEKDDDPQRNFILQAWPRLSEVLKEDFQKYAAIVAPSLVNLIKDLIENIPKYDVEEDEDEPEYPHTYYDAECTNAIDALSRIFEDCPIGMSPYVEMCASVIFPLLSYKNSEEVRGASAEALPNMLKSLSTDPNYASQIPGLSHKLMDKVWEAMDKEDDPEVLIRQATAIQELIELGGNTMTLAQLETVYNNCLHHLKKSDLRKKENDSQTDAEEDEPELIEVRELEKDTEDQFHCTIAEVLGKLFKTHKATVLPIYEQLHNMFIATSLVDTQRDMIKKFGLFVICDAVEHLGQHISPARLEEYYAQLKKHSNYPMLFVRHAAVFGIGVMALQLGDKFVPCLKEALTLLQSSLKVPKGVEDEGAYQATKDNTVSAVGKVIKATWSSIGNEHKVFCINAWIELLPLHADLVEAIIQHEYLIEWIETDSAILFNRPENYRRCVDILTTIYDTGVSNKTLDAKIRQISREWLTNPITSVTLKDLGLTDKLRSRFQDVI